MADLLKQRVVGIILIVFPLGLISFFGTCFFLEQRITEIIPAPEQTQPAKQESGKETISIILVGDIMFDRGVEYMINKNGAGDFKFPFSKIANDLKNADILFGNLEGPISDKGANVGSIYSFQNDPKTIEGLTFAGFDVISLANNHAFDYGRKALEDTFLRLKTAGIKYVGAGFNEKEAYSPVIKEVNGTKIGFLAYTNLGSPYWTAAQNSSGIAWADWDNLEKINPSTELRVDAEQSRSIKEDIKNVKSQADILIISLHSGEEYTTEPTQFQIEFSKAAIDAGADIIAGTHPHVAQKNEIYQNGYIFYSLGNFIFDQSFSEETMKGFLLEVVIKDKKIKEIKEKEIKINESFQPEILPKIIFSFEKPEQSDTLLIKIEENPNMQEINGDFNGKKIEFLKIANSSNLIGILGIDAKEKLGNYELVINFPNDQKIKKEITVIKREFPVTELSVTKELEEKGYTPSKIIENIATKENLELEKVLSIYTPKAYFNKSFIYPLEKIKDVGAYGNIRKNENLAAQHLGVDLEAEPNTPVYAINDGMVRFSKELNTYGKTLIIDHGLGIFSLYLHLNEFKFSEGDLVKQGEIIGLSGNTGYSISPHLHFSVKVNGASVDPLKFIKTIKEGTEK